jgi:O-antigen ligase
VRFTTVFAKRDATQLSQEERARLGGDIGSSEGREMLLWQAIGMTKEHPIVGVGPGIFADAAWDERKANSGVGGGLLVSHNTYTQLSSEIGIPGFLFFVIALFLCIKHALRDYRNTRGRHPPFASGSLYVFVCLIGLAVGIFFLSVGYSMLLAVLFALATSLHESIKLETVQVATAESHPDLLERPAPESADRPEAPRRRTRENRLNGRRVRLGRFAGREPDRS